METLAELLVKISADATELKKGLVEAEKDIEKTGKSFEQFAKDNKQAFKTVGIAVTAFGAAITGLMTIAVRSFAGMGTGLKELSQKTGISVESLSELKYAGEMTGVSLDSLAIAIRSMANFMDTAIGGTKESTATLKKLGLSISDLEGLSPEQTFMKLSSAIASIPDPMRRSALAVDVFGRSGTQLLPMLAEGQNGIDKLRQKAKELGITMSTETAEGADALGDALDTVKSSIGGVFNAIGNALAPILIDLASKISDVLSDVISWAKENPILFKNILLVASGLGVLALAIGPIIIMLPQLLTQLAALKIAFITLNAAIGPVGWAIAGITAALVIGLPFLISAIDTTRDLTAAERDLAEGTARLNLQNKVGASEWANLSQGGKIYEHRLASIANGAGITKKELYAMLKAAGMIQDVWGGEEGTIYLKSLADINKGLEKVADTSEEVTDEMITNLRNLSSEARRRANETTRVQVDAIDETMRAENKAHSEKMSSLDEEYSALIKNIDAQLGIVLEGYQSQLDAIDRLTEAEDLTRTRADEQTHIAELKALFLSAKTVEEYSKTKQDLAEYETEVTRNELLRRREDEKDAIRQMMDEARQKAQFAKDTEETTYETKRSLLEKAHNDLLDGLENDKIALDVALTEQLARYDEDIKKYDETIALKLLHLDEFIKKYNEALLGMGIIPTPSAGGVTPGAPTTVTPAAPTAVGVTPTVVLPPEAFTGTEPIEVGGFTITPPTTPWSNPDIPLYQKGGIVGETGLAYLHEGETVIPANESVGNIVVNFTQPVFFDREDTMNKFVDMVRKGIQRQDRLRFGGAWDGR